MKYFIIAGEQSGDLHGSNLIKELLKADKNAVISCWGGDLMQAAGARLLVHYRNTAFMGFVIVLKNLKKITRNLKLCKQQIAGYKPDVVILIDYPGFNLRIAKYARTEGFKVFYYISPKFWAWNEKRVKKIKMYVDKMYIIFPFETEFYRKHAITVEYMGNPLVDETERRIATFPSKEEIRKSLNVSDKPVVALLAGSRSHEVESMLPQMIKVVSSFPDHQFLLAGVKNLPEELYLRIIGNEKVKLVTDKTYELLKIADAALVASGTATLETALLQTPQVVCFRGDFFSMLIAWFVVRVKYISLVNLIMNEEVVKEVLGYLVNKKNLVRELKAILPGGEKRDKMLADYMKLKEKLGPAGASQRIAMEMVRELRVASHE